MNELNSSMQPSLHGSSRRKSALLLLFMSLSITFVWCGYFALKAYYERTIENRLVDRVEECTKKINDLINKYKEQGYARIQEPIFYSLLAPLLPSDAHTIEAPEFAAHQQKLATFFEQYNAQFLYRNNLIMRADGLVVFSDFAASYVGKNLFQEPYNKTALAESCTRVVMSLTPDVADFAYDPVLGEPLFCVTIPIIQDDVCKAVLVQQLPTESIYAIFDNYLGLGKEGDLVSAKKIPEGILLTTRSRIENNMPLKELHVREVGETFSYPLELGALGYKDAGIVTDYLKRRVVAAWQFIPNVNWGVVAKYTVSELNSNVFPFKMIAWVLTFLCIILFIFIYYHHVGVGVFFSTLYLYSKKPRVQYGLKIGFLLACMAGLVVLFLFKKNNVRAQRQEMHTIAQVSLRKTIDSIHDLLIKVENIGQNFSRDLSCQKISQQDLVAYIKQTLIQNDEIQAIGVAFAPYAFLKEQRLYAPFVYKKGKELIEENSADTYDYTKEQPVSESLEKETSFWYGQSMHTKKTIWYAPYNRDQFYGSYSMPFFAPDDKEKKNPLGVLYVMYRLDEIQQAIRTVSVGQTGYAFLLSHQGVYLEHPMREYAERQKTLQEVAQERGSIALLNIAQSMQKDEEGSGEYVWNAPLKRYIFYAPIPLVQWTLAVVFDEDALALPATTERHYSIVFIWLVVCLFLALFWLGFNLTPIRRAHRLWLALLSAGAVMGLFYFVKQDIHQSEQSIIMTDQVHLNQFVQERLINARSVSEKPPLVVPFGLLVYELGFHDPTILEVSGYTWLKYPINLDKRLIQTPDFPQAIAPVSIKKSYEKREGEFIIIGWQFNAHLAQEFDFKTYPFDVLNVRIDVEHPNMSENILLVPDFADYAASGATGLPGVYAHLYVPGFTLSRSYFSFDKQNTAINFGLRSYQETSNRYYLSFHCILKRQLLYDIIVFLLPLFIVFLMLYIIPWIAEKDWLPIITLSSYTGLFFATILLHRILRDRYKAADTLYLEYLFFLIYLTLIPLVCYVLFKVYLKKDHSWVLTAFTWWRTYYWSIQAMVLFVITTVVFY